MAVSHPPQGRDTKLKLLIKDQDDLALVSGLMQDALVVVQDMAYDADNASFLLLASRFLWERADLSKAPEDFPLDQDARFEDVPHASTARHFRRHAVLRIEHVTHVAQKNLPKDKKANLNFLSAQLSEDGSQLDLVFSGTTQLRLTLDRLLAGLEDVGEPWPTLSRPHHE